MKVKSEREVAQSCLILATPWTAAYQAPPSMGFSRQEYWSGVPLPSPLGHSTTLKEGKNSFLLENTRTHPQAHIRTICVLSSIEPSHPGSRHDPRARFPCVHPKVGFSLPTALSLFLLLSLIQIQSHSSAQWTYAMYQELSTCQT